MNTMDIIKYIEDKPTNKSRKLTMSDLFNTPEDTNVSIQKSFKIQKYRMQGEYGTKKFIKP